MRIAVLLLAACGSSTSSSTKREPPPPAPAASASDEVTLITAPSMDEIIAAGAYTPGCLPVVAKNCKCTYDCMYGRSKDQRTWWIEWHGKDIAGVVENYCVDGKCTDVFAVELTCDGICAPKPANPNCRLEGAGIIECKSS
jgi:hypothetical protein